MVQRYDLLVVGAGPAGSTAAYEAANRGLKVLVIDRCEFPRSIACGGFVSEKVLAQPKFEVPRTLVEKEIYKLRYVSHKAKTVDLASSHRLGVVVRRVDFDSYLLQQAQAAGADFHSQEWPTGISLGTYSVVATNKNVYHAEYVIGADGVYSSVAQLTGLRNTVSRWRINFAMSTIIKTQTKAGIYDVFTLYNIPTPWGLGWCVPLRGGYNVGLRSPALLDNRLKKHFPHFIQRVVDSLHLTGYTAEDAEGGYVPNGYLLRKLPVVNRNVVLVGDAAGLADPFTGEGIYYAICSARLAIRYMVDNRLNELHHCYHSNFHAIFKPAHQLSLITGRKRIFDLIALRNSAVLKILADNMQDEDISVSLISLAKAVTHGSE